MFKRHLGQPGRVQSKQIRGAFAEQRRADPDSTGLHRVFQIVTGREGRAAFDRQAREARRTAAENVQVQGLKREVQAERNAPPLRQASEFAPGARYAYVYAIALNSIGAGASAMGLLENTYKHPPTDSSRSLGIPAISPPRFPMHASGKPRLLPQRDFKHAAVKALEWLCAVALPAFCRDG